jgi:hypothetical protein
MAFCTRCGTPTGGGEGKRFCTKCGAPLPAGPGGEEPPTVFTPGPLVPEPPTFVSPPGSWPPAQPGQGSAWPAAQPGQPTTTGPAAWPPSAPPGQNVPGQPRPPDRPRPGRSAAWIGFVVALVLVLGGGFAAWKFLGHHTTNHPPAAGSPTGPANGTGPGSSKSPAPSSPTPPAPSPTPAGFPVAVSASAAQGPDEPHVLQFLQRYFAAINNHDYGKYAPLLMSSQRPTPQQFQTGFSTTADSAATLTALAPTPTGVAATVTFTSHQSPSQSPTSTGCDTWHITLFLQPHGGAYRIGPAQPGYHAQYQAC